MTLAELKQQVDELVAKGVHPLTEVKIEGVVDIFDESHGHIILVKPVDRVEVRHSGGLRVAVISRS